VVYNVVTMTKVNIREFKAHLSALIERVEAGETIIVSKRNSPIAELRPIVRRTAAAMLGQPVQGLHVGPAFFEPLPDDIIDAFVGNVPR
jgi:prevent-host-death family protein